MPPRQLIVPSGLLADWLVIFAAPNNTIDNELADVLWDNINSHGTTIAGGDRQVLFPNNNTSNIENFAWAGSDQGGDSNITRPGFFQSPATATNFRNAFDNTHSLYLYVEGQTYEWEIVPSTNVLSGRLRFGNQHDAYRPSDVGDGDQARFIFAESNQLSIVSNYIRDTNIPATPAAPTLTAGDMEIAVNWAEPDDNGWPITGYDLEYSTNNGGTYTEIDVGDVTTYDITSLTNGVAVLVRVRARNDVGNSDYGPTASATPFTSNLTPVITNVANQSATYGTAFSVQLPEAISGDLPLTYTLTGRPAWLGFVASTRTMSGTPNAVGLSTLTYTVTDDDGDTDSTTFTIAVAATLPERVASSSVSFVEGSAQGSVVVSWDAPSDGGSTITNYTIRNRIQGSGDAWAEPVFGPATTQTISNLTLGETYQFRIAATNTVGQGLYSLSVPYDVPQVPAPVSSFTTSITNLAVAFTDTSTNTPTSWAWDFDGDGTSTLQNPSHTFSAAGTYSVSLTATNAGGANTSSTNVTVTAALPNPPVAAFTRSISNLVVAFTDTSTNTPTAWAWDFGDNGTSTQQNPSHTYAAAGTYAVELTATNAGGSDDFSSNITVTTALPNPPVANFSSSISDLVVSFTDLSFPNATSWSWDFGDGGSSTQQNPTHTYASAGTYSVELIATNAGGSDDRTRNVTVAPEDLTPTAPNVSNRSGTVGVAFSTTLPVGTGGNPPLTYAVTGRPAWLAFNTTSLSLSGTPTAVGVSNLTYVVTDDDGDTDSSTFSITVSAADLTPNAPAVANRSGIVGTAFSITLPVGTGGDPPLSYSVSGLPSWASFNINTRVLSGTPDAAGTSTITYTVEDDDGDTDSVAFTIAIGTGIVSEITLQSLTDGTNEDARFLVTVETEVGSEEVWYGDDEDIGSIVGDANLPPTIDHIAMRADAEGLVFLRDTGGNFSTWTVTNPDKSCFIVANDSNGVATLIEFTDNKFSPGSNIMRIVRVFMSSDEQAVLDGVAHGHNVLLVFADAGSVQLDSSGDLTPTAPAVADQSGIVGTAFSITLPVGTGGDAPLAYSVSGLPSWASFNISTRVLSGTPDAVATTTITYTVTDDDGDTASTAFMLTVSVADTSPTLPAVAAQSGTVGTPFVLTLPEATGGNAPLAYSVSGRPTWMSFNAGTRLLSGTPTDTGTTTLTYGVEDTDGDTDSTDFDITVAAALVSAITLQTLTTGTGEQARFLVTVETEVGSEEVWYGGTLGIGSITGDANLPPIIDRVRMRAGFQGLTFNSDGVGSFITWGDDNTGTSLFIGLEDGNGDPVLIEVVNADFVLFATGMQARREFMSDAEVALMDAVADGHMVLFVFADADSVQLAGGDLTPTAPTIADQSGVVGTAFSVTLDPGTGGDPPLTYAVTGRPAWLAFDATSRVLSGTPTAAGTSALTYTVTDDDGDSDSDDFDLVVTAALPNPPVAAFTSSINDLTASFTDTSTNAPTSWAWNFGDNGTSTQQNPSHTYASAGTYSVQLTATNAGGSDIFSASVTVTDPLPDPPVANFITSTSDLVASFTDTSTNTPTSWAWDFDGDGTSTLQNPSHTFSAAGTYSVSLTATNAGGSNTRSINVTVTAALPNPPVANFTSSITNLVVAFTDTSTNTPTSWAWGFGDGGSSTLQNPSHTYASAGTYSVVLIATNAGGSNNSSSNITVAAAATAPEAATDLIGIPGDQQIALTWTLNGDGGSPLNLVRIRHSNDQNPTNITVDVNLDATSHTLTGLINGATYTISIRKANILGGTNSAEIEVTPNAALPDPPVAGFTSSTNDLAASFTDTSTNTPTSWLWNFDDGGISTQQNPSHTYAAAGTYTVQLTATNTGGSNIFSADVTVTAPDTSPTAPTIANQSAVVGTAYSATLDAGTGGNPPLSYSVAGRPAWLAFNITTRVLSGTPTAAGTTTLIYVVTDDDGDSDSAVFNMVVTAALPNPPVADFSRLITDLSVAFTDTSTNTPTSWAWDFDDGNTSTAQNPSHTYASAGTYTVTLTATNAGGSNDRSKTFSVTAPDLTPTAPTIADQSGVVGTPFSATLAVGTGGDPPLSYAVTGRPAWLAFNATSRVLSGTPTSTGTRALTYTVTDVDGDSDSDDFDLVVTAALPDPPVTNFSRSITNLSVAFTDTSTNTPTSWAWDFDDGNTSTAQNPSHTYASAGTYTVTLTATNAGGSDDRSKTFSVTAPDLTPTAPTIANQSGVVGTPFSITLAVGTGGDPPLSYVVTGRPAWLAFNATSRVLSGTPTSTGTRALTYTVTDVDGDSDSDSFNLVVTAAVTPVAGFASSAFGLAASFTDTSTNVPVSWAWDFGDGGSSTAQSPTHSYAIAGTYTVELTATNTGGSDTFSSSVTVSPPPPASLLRFGSYEFPDMNFTISTNFGTTLPNYISMAGQRGATRLDGFRQAQRGRGTVAATMRLHNQADLDSMWLLRSALRGLAERGLQRLYYRDGGVGRYCWAEVEDISMDEDRATAPHDVFQDTSVIFAVPEPVWYHEPAIPVLRFGDAGLNFGTAGAVFGRARWTPTYAQSGSTWEFSYTYTGTAWTPLQVAIRLTASSGSVRRGGIGIMRFSEDGVLADNLRLGLDVAVDGDQYLVDGARGLLLRGATPLLPANGFVLRSRILALSPGVNIFRVTGLLAGDTWAADFYWDDAYV